MRIGGFGMGMKPGRAGNRVPPELADELRDIPRHKLEWLAEVLALAAIVAQIVLLAVSYGALPELVPTHFGFSGQPDGYGSRGTLLVLVAANIIMYMMMTVMTAFPRSYNYPVIITAQNMRRQYLLVRWMVAGLKVLLAWMFFYISYQSMAVAMGLATNIGPAIWIFMGLLTVGLTLVLVLSFKWR